MIVPPLPENGEREIVEFHDAEERPSLEQAQAIVGGYVEMIVPPHNPHIQILVNEEGLLMRLPVNMEASRLAGRMIVGKAVLLSGHARWK
jgi:hypothetical protein